MATGDRVRLAVESAGEMPEQARWAVRCDALQKVRHRAIAPLVDYGMLGITQRFEAWRCGARWEGVAAEGKQRRDLAARFLCSVGLTPCGQSLDRVCVGDGDPRRNAR